MSAFWASLPAGQQDLLWFVALILPAVLVGALVMRGFRPGALVLAMLWRFRWANLLFVSLIAISVGIGIGLLAQERGLRRATAASADKFDLVIAAPGSEMTLLLAAVYLQPTDVPLLSGEVFETVAGHDNVDLAAPLAFGDSFRDSPVIGTTGAFVRHLSDNRIEGRIFASSHEAVVGARAAAGLGETIVPAHGHGDAADAHAHDAEITVVGRMRPTGTPWDKAILVPVEQIWEVHGLANGHAPAAPDHIGPPFDPAYFPGTPAIIVHAKNLWANYALRSEFDSDQRMMAFFPGTVLAQLHALMGDIRQVMSIMSLTAQVLVAASVLTGLVILIRLFRRQLALLRALGAPARFVFSVVWSYAGTLLMLGAGLGLPVGQIATWVLSRVVTQRTDIHVLSPLGWPEFHFVAAFVSLSAVFALLPALTMLRQPIVPSLRA